MFARNLIVAVGLVAFSGIAAAEGFKTSQSGNVANVYGRSGIPAVHAGATVVTRTAREVVPGPTAVQGPTAVAIGSGDLEVNQVQGRS
jgi:hypothetical protein